MGDRYFRRLIAFRDCVRWDIPVVTRRRSARRASASASASVRRVSLAEKEAVPL